MVPTRAPSTIVAPGRPRAKWGRRLWDVSGRGHVAVLQRCGGAGLYTVVLYSTVEEARKKRGDDCGYDGGPAGCEPQWHGIVDLLALTEVEDRTSDGTV